MEELFRESHCPDNGESLPGCLCHVHYLHHVHDLPLNYVLVHNLVVLDCHFCDPSRPGCSRLLASCPQASFWLSSRWPHVQLASRPVVQLASRPVEVWARIVDGCLSLSGGVTSCQHLRPSSGREHQFEWRFYALSASEAIFRARTYSCITYSVRWWGLLDEWK